MAKRSFQQSFHTRKTSKLSRKIKLIISLVICAERFAVRPGRCYEVGEPMSYLLG